MSDIEHFDTLILGSGQGGKLLAWHLGAFRSARRGRGASLGWRCLPGCRLLAEQE